MSIASRSREIQRVAKWCRRTERKKTASFAAAMSAKVLSSIFGTSSPSRITGTRHPRISRPFGKSPSKTVPNRNPHQEELPVAN